MAVEQRAAQEMLTVCASRADSLDGVLRLGHENPANSDEYTWWGHEVVGGAAAVVQGPGP